MKEYHKVSYESTQVKKVTCDLCKAVSDSILGWDLSAFGVAETEVSMRSGTSYPDGGGTVFRHEVDLCPKCFRFKLIPWLESQGATITETEEN